jgi:CBS domain-containing protein
VENRVEELSMRVEDVMKRAPVYVQAHETCQQAARRMRDRGLGFLPVCDRQRRVIGTVTDRDITIRVVAEGLQFKQPVGDVMGFEVVACHRGDDLERARIIMKTSRKARLVVLDDMGRLEGVLSFSDVSDDAVAVSSVASPP